MTAKSDPTGFKIFGQGSINRSVCANCGNASCLEYCSVCGNRLICSPKVRRDPDSYEHVTRGIGGRLVSGFNMLGQFDLA